jgi:hypothetical protein
VIRASAAQLVAEPELALDGGQVAHDRERRVGTLTALARRLSDLLLRLLVQRDTELRRPLEDVEQLDELQPEKRDEHDERVDDRE